MPNVTVTNLHTGSLVLPTNSYPNAIQPGDSATFSVDDVDEFMGDSGIAGLIAGNYISVAQASAATGDIYPTPVAATASLPTATAVADGTLYFDSDRNRLVVQNGDAWVTEPTVTAAATGALPAAPPDDAIAYSTTANTLYYYNGAAWVSCSLSNPINVAAAVPGAPVAGEIAHETTTNTTQVYTGAAWAQIDAMLSGTVAAPPAEASTAAGGNYFNTDNDRISLHDGTNWLNLPVMTVDTQANINTMAGAGIATGMMGFSTDTLTWIHYDGAQWAVLPQLLQDTSANINTAAGAGIAAGMMAYSTTTDTIIHYDGANWLTLPHMMRDTQANIATAGGAGLAAGMFGWNTDTNRVNIYTGAAWFDQATVGAHATTGAVAAPAEEMLIFVEAGFQNAELGRGRLYEYNRAAWRAADYVVPGYVNVAAFPVAGDVPVGTLALDLSGAGADYIHVSVGGAWQPVAA